MNLFRFHSMGTGGTVKCPADKGPAQPHGVRPGLLAGKRVADNDAGALAGQGLPGVASIGNSRQAGFQGQPVYDIRGAYGGKRDSPFSPVEIETVDDCGLAAIGFVRRFFVRIIVVRKRQPAIWNTPELPPSGQDIFPQLSRRCCVRISTCQSNDSNCRWR